MAITSSDVNTSKTFRKTALIDKPVQTFKSAPRISPNPYTGLPLTGPYDQAHHIVPEAPDTVAEATESNPL